MNKEQQAELAAEFRARHSTKPVLLLPNVWDAMSARMFAAIISTRSRGRRVQSTHIKMLH